MFLNQIIFSECNAMLKYALGIGLKVPNEIVENIQKCTQNVDVADDVLQKDSSLTECIVLLNRTHNQLSKIVAPAKPNTLALFEKEEKNNFLKSLGPVPLVRRMMLIAIFSLVALIMLSTSPYVNGDPKSFGLTTNDGTSLLINQLFLMSAASIGASFASLFQVNEYIKNATYNPMYESTYWVRFVLGLLAGTMLATLIPIESIGDSETSTNGFAGPLLSLIGGFSASVVFRILTRLTMAIESIFKGDIQEILAAQEIRNNMKVEEQNIQTKLQILNQLKNLQSKINSGTDSKGLLDELDAVQKQLLDNDEK